MAWFRSKHEQNINSTCPAETELCGLRWKCLPVREVVALSECEIDLRHALREVDELCLCQRGPARAMQVRATRKLLQNTGAFSRDSARYR